MNFKKITTGNMCGQAKPFSSYDAETVSSRISVNFVCIPNGISVKEAMRQLIVQAACSDNISTIYVVDNNNVFLGAIALKDLIIARDGQSLDEFTVTSYPYVYAAEPIEACIPRIRKYAGDSIPVLDDRNRLLGVLTAQDLSEIIGDEMSEDYARLAGLQSEEDLLEPLSKSIVKRLPWLLVLFGLGLIVSGVVGLFETVVASLTLIVFFQSLILDMAGNVGTQSLAITIRVLTDEDLSAKQKLSLALKEAKVAFFNGLILGMVSFICIGLYLRFFKGEALTVSFSVSFCTGVSLLVSMLLSGISGTVVPIIFKKLKIDPAVASGPFITTVNDLVAVVIYYGLAWILLINVLHI